MQPVDDPSRRPSAVLWLVGCALAALVVVTACDVMPDRVLDTGSLLTASSGAGARADGDLHGRTVEVTDAGEPAVANLDPALRTALEAATKAASDDDVVVRITSGWRSRAYQRRLFDEAVAERGSREEALRWVKLPDDSAHVSGEAVDVGATDAAYWMSRHGSRFGLCQTYANEIWHYELGVDRGGACPPPLVDGSS